MTRIPGEHAPNIKNRSSKHLNAFTKIRPVYRCLSNAALEEMAKNKSEAGSLASKELNRRAKKRAKREAKA